MFAATEAQWAFFGVVVATMGPIIALLIRNRQGHKATHRQLEDLAFHVNNVEEDIDHSTGPTLGQQVKQMADHLDDFIIETRDVHTLILDSPPSATVTMFCQAFINSDEPAYHSVAMPDHDPPWKVAWANRAWHDLVGLDEMEAATHQYLADIHPDDLDAVVAAAKQAWAYGEVLHIRYRIKVSDDWQEIQVHAEPYRNLRGEVLGQLGVIKVCGKVDG